MGEVESALSAGGLSAKAARSLFQCRRAAIGSRGETMVLGSDSRKIRLSKDSSAEDENTMIRNWSKTWVASVVSAAALAGSLSTAQAAVKYWDRTGATPGAATSPENKPNESAKPCHTQTSSKS